MSKLKLIVDFNVIQNLEGVLYFDEMSFDPKQYNFYPIVILGDLPALLTRKRV